MNRNDILIDFLIHLLLSDDETYNEELRFFSSRDKALFGYKEYLDTIKKLIDVDDIIWDTDLWDSNRNKPITELKELTDIITEKDIEFLGAYIYDEFIFGYPNEFNEYGFPNGGSYGLSFSKDEIKSYFKDYLKLRIYNPNHYISYYEQYVNYITGHYQFIRDIKKNINNFCASEQMISSPLYSKLKDDFEANLRQDLLKSTQSTKFKVIGSFDENGFILNYNETLKLILQFENSIYSNPRFSFDLESIFALVNYEYFRYKTDGELISEKSEEAKNQKEEFENFKKKNNSQIKFLKAKHFSNQEIDIILNCFSLNKFNLLPIRQIRDLKKIEYYRLFYFFYRFDFLKDSENLKFDKQNDFNSLPLSIGVIDENQYYKYHKASTELIQTQYEQKNHPFASLSSVQKLLNKIKLDLCIDENKLNIPQYLTKLLK